MTLAPAEAARSIRNAAVVNKLFTILLSVIPDIQAACFLCGLLFEASSCPMARDRVETR